jgi:hypothetical protein
MLRPSPRSIARSLSFLVAVATAAIVSLNCGGRVDGDTPTGACPANLAQACPANATCTTHVKDCLGERDETCTCDGTGWSCPKSAGCPNPCADVKPNAACTAEGTFCKSSQQPNCPYPTNDGCSCTNGKWLCLATICGDPPPPVPACPPPSKVFEGKSCSGNGTCSGTLQCPKGGSVGVNFDCVNGRWVMWEYFVDPCETIDPDDGGVIITDGGTKG